ncbi:MAG: helix-turn-helix transcriptional regulator [Defluviitaleaceae bacterium]|nr:helix-turn-helix transcriptional regulator [Defluviitaleaceae bacterium]
MNYSTLSLGEKIQQIRKSKGLSMENLAHAAGCNMSTISRIENGQLECSDEMLATIKKFMEIGDAPLLKHELESYKDHLWLVHATYYGDKQLVAESMIDSVFPITELPFEHDLCLLYSMLKVKFICMRFGETGDNSAADEILSKAEALLDWASKDTLHVYHFNKGICYWQDKDYKNSLKHYLKTLDLVGDNAKPQALHFLYIGDNYRDLGMPYYSIIYYERAKLMFTGDQFNVIRINIDIHLALSYMMVGRFHKAKRLHETSLSYAKNRKINFYIGMLSNDLSYICRKTGDLEEALMHCEQAIVNLDNTPYSVFALYSKADTLLLMKEHAKCSEVIDNGKPLAMKYEDKTHTVLFETLSHMINLTTKKDNISTAYIENIAIPHLRTCEGQFRLKAVDLCEDLEAYYKKNRSNTKALTMAAIARDIYKEMIYGDEDFDID